MDVRYGGEDPEKQKKIEELSDIREAYRRQRRLWLWMIAISIFSSSILLHRSSTLSIYLAIICLSVGLYPLWNVIKCNRAVRMIDKGLAPYEVQEGRAKK